MLTSHLTTVAIQGATVTVDDQLTSETGANGIASFTGIRKGAHTVSVAIGKQKLSKNIQLGSSNAPSTTIVIATKPNLLLDAAIGLVAMLLLGAASLSIKRSASKKRQPANAETVAAAVVEPEK